MNTLVLALLQPFYLIFKILGNKNSAYPNKLFALFLVMLLWTIVHILIDNIWWTIVYEGGMILDIYPEW